MHRHPSRHALSFVALATAGLMLVAAPLDAARQKSIPATPDVKTASHVLNRVGFGARPGDVERVQKIGVAAYIEEQLHPERIDDSRLDARLAEFGTLQMSTGELAERYFVPALQARRNAASPGSPASPGANGRPDMASGSAAADRAQDPGMAMTDGRAASAPTPAMSPEMRQAQALQAGQRVVLAELTQAKMLRAAMSDRQLQEVLTDFWFNHFNVFVGKGQVRQYFTEYDRDTIRPHVLGTFRDLLGAVAHSPAMLFYLDNWQSATPETPAPLNNPALESRLNDPRLRPAQREQLRQRVEQMRAQAQKRPQRGLNENYARELMELHTLGVDAGYTQQDVIALAKILTGWTIDRPQQGGQFVFRPQMHDTSTKKFLGMTFTSAGQSEGERALDLLASQPATAHHLAFKLAQRFVADEPSAALVDRAAKTFLDTKGDIREVVRTLLTSAEFSAPEAFRTKVKTPFEFVVSAVRATGATIVSAQPLVAAMQNLGMPIFGCQPPTGYSMTADAWVNTGSLLNRMNFGVQLMSGGRIQPVGPGREGGAAGARGQLGAGRGQAARGPLQVDVFSLARDTSESSRDELVQRILAGVASDGTRRTLGRADSPQSLVALTLGSPEFQRR